MAQTVLELVLQGPRAGGEFHRGTAFVDTFALPTSPGDAKLCPFAGFSGGLIYVSAAVTITWYAAETLAATVKAVHDHLGNAVTQVIDAEGWAMIPPAVFGAAVIAPVSGGAANAKLLLKK